MQDRRGVVLKRRARDFDEHDRERLELLRPHLAFLYLEHIYVKLGVETRTAAVMRALAVCNHASLWNSDHFLV